MLADIVFAFRPKWWDWKGLKVVGLEVIELLDKVKIPDF